MGGGEQHRRADPGRGHDARAIAALNANGTGPFKIESHQPGVKTVFKPNTDWWGKAEHNLDEIVFTPIASDATRVAALLSGEVDVIEPVPLQDIQRVNGSRQRAGAGRPRAPHHLPRLRPDPRRAAVLEREGQEPLQGQAKVREAFYKAIDIETIKSRVMRGLSSPSALMIAPELFSRSRRTSCVRNTIPKAPRSSWPMRVTRTASRSAWTARTTATSMTRRSARPSSACWPASGIKVNLMAQPKAQYFAKVLKSGNYNTSFYLLGWTPGTFDSHNVLFESKAAATIRNPRGASRTSAILQQEA